jgi:hypothetical protein
MTTEFFRTLLAQRKAPFAKIFPSISQIKNWSFKSLGCTALLAFEPDRAEG